MRKAMSLCCLAAALLPSACAPTLSIERFPEAAMRTASPALAAEAVGGVRKVANAAWWGFNETDATEALQAAVDSGASTLIVPNLGKPWVVSRTIRLASFQTVLLERGVEIVAMEGKFRGKGEVLFLAHGCRHLTLHGYGATLRMRKADYQKPPYAKGEWRHALSLRGCSDVKVLGLTLRDSGGDGIYIGTAAEQPYCKSVHIQDVTCDSNHRQGISVITADGLLIENCRLLNTRGTAPQAGIDLEPNHPNERLANVVIRHCLVEGNAGPGIFAYLKYLAAGSAPISILVEDCTVRRCGSFGIGGGALGDDGPGGYFTFWNVTVADTNGPGAYVYDKSADRARFRFVRCRFERVARKSGSPIAIVLRRPDLAKRLGGVAFYDCAIEDDRDRPAVVIGGKPPEQGVWRVRGSIAVHNPHGARMDLGPAPENIRLQLAP